MLSVYLGDCENEIYNPPLYFINQYEDSWLETDLAKRMIKDVDKSEVVGSKVLCLDRYRLASCPVVSKPCCY
mgnify:CR=1 FL=1